MTKSLMLLSGDLCSEGVQTDVDVLVTAVNLLDVADDAGSVRRHGSDKEGDTGTDVR